MDFPSEREDGISTSAIKDNMSKLLLAMVLIAALAFTNSCGTGDQVRAKNAMLASMAAYARCLEQNPSDHSKCESLKNKYEADLKTYREASKGTSPILTGFIEVGP